MNNEKVKNIIEAESEKIKFLDAKLSLGLWLYAASCIIKKLNHCWVHNDYCWHDDCYWHKSLKKGV